MIKFTSSNWLLALALLLGLIILAAVGCGKADPDTSRNEIADIPIFPTEKEIDMEKMQQALAAGHRFELTFNADTAEVVKWYEEKLSAWPGFTDRLTLTEPCPVSGVEPAENPDPDSPYGSWIIRVDKSHMVVNVQKHQRITLVNFVPQ